ncbi:MAG: hypothetical protein M3342_16220, partial [Bacteroidota bacterium]|nr:hypothetical protein [Bacteroidota bacterium]
EANALFAETLQAITLSEVSLKVLEHFCASFYRNGGQSSEQEIQKLKADIQKNKERLSTAQQLLLDGTLAPEDYKEIKNRYEPTVRALENRLVNMSQQNNDMDDMIAYGRKFFKRLDAFYNEGTLAVKQQLIGSIFPEKLIFENKSYRTIEDNPLIPLICRPGKAFRGWKNIKPVKMPVCQLKLPLLDLNQRPSD